jgi:hypothetical protein
MADDDHLQLDKTHTAALNLAVLQRMDPAVVSIVASANHVAIYSFDSALQQWEKKNIDGACFITERYSGSYEYNISRLKIHINTSSENT